VKLSRADTGIGKEFADNTYSLPTMGGEVEDEVRGYGRSKAPSVTVVFDREPLVEFLTPLPSNPNNLNITIQHYYSFRDDTYTIFTGKADELPSYINDILYDKISITFESNWVVKGDATDLKDSDTNDYFVYTNIKDLYREVMSFYNEPYSEPISEPGT
jgi:hypothetical protein